MILAIDLIAMVLSFGIAFFVRSMGLTEKLGATYGFSTYLVILACAFAIYVLVFLLKRKPHLERQSYKEIILSVLEQQILFAAVYICLFFVFRKIDLLSRFVIVMFIVGNILLCSLGRILYHNYCVHKGSQEKPATKAQNATDKSMDDVQHVYIIGSKSIGMYGGYESFVMNLLQQHQDNPKIKYHVACKANGQGYMNLSKLPGTTRINDDEFTYCNAHGYLITVPEKIGSAQALYFDVRALNWACNHIEKNHIPHPVVYILASRIGPFEKPYMQRIHDAGGRLLQNPDGHEDWRRKWSPLIRKYWKLSERYAVKYADLVVCDSKNIESYIQAEYAQYHPQTCFIAYGSRVFSNILADDDPKYVNWLKDHNLTDGNFYISVGRFVPENNFDIMIREFMASHTQKDFAVITTEDGKFAAELQQKLQYKKDQRIKFVGTVYDVELLAKIRSNAYGYFHGHEVGGTNPSLLEALGTTKLNLLYDVGFNREVAEDTALYWSKQEGDLAELIDYADQFGPEQISDYGTRAKNRMKTEYSWEKICGEYEKIWRIIK